MSRSSFQVKFHFCLLILSAVFFAGCSVAESKIESAKQAEDQSVRTAETGTENLIPQGRIKVTANSPADAIRTFYKNLRENRFREAIFLTNLRPAVEGLTDAELRDLQVDFANLAQIIPADIQINGEIITNEKATVTAKIPDEQTGEMQVKEFKLAKENGGWKILMVDERDEAVIRREGKNYFFSLRIEVHHSEVEKTMQKIYKAQTVYALQNGGVYADLAELVGKGLLSDAVNDSVSTGYRYNLSLSADKKKYTASAEPMVYDRTGKLSYLLEVGNAKQQPMLKQEDKKGKPLKS